MAAMRKCGVGPARPGHDDKCNRPLAQAPARQHASPSQISAASLTIWQYLGDSMGCMVIVSPPVRFTRLALYRSGNASSPRLSAVRLNDAPDIETGVDPTGRLTVIAGSGGVSVWSYPDRRWRKTWMLPAGSGFRPELTISRDTSTHWLIAPSHDMLFSRYIAALETLDLEFVRIE